MGVHKTPKAAWTSAAKLPGTTGKVLAAHKAGSFGALGKLLPGERPPHTKLLSAPSVRPVGRRAVAGKLDWIQQTQRVTEDDVWDEFISTIWPWIFGRAWRTDDEPLLEVKLRAAGSTPYDGLIPWLWREWRRVMASAYVVPGEQAALYTPFKINSTRDWYIGARPNIMRFSLTQAGEAAELWHEEQANAAALRPSRALSASALRDFTRFRSWEDGFWVGHYTPRGESHRSLQAVGHTLGHCYQRADLAKTYAAEYDLWTLFDGENRPHWTCATMLRGGEEDESDPPQGIIEASGIMEIKAKANSPVLPVHFPYLHELLRLMIERYGPDDDALDYANAEGLFQHTKHDTVVWHGKGRLTFTGKDRRRYQATWAEDYHELFTLVLLCPSGTFRLTPSSRTRWDQAPGAPRAKGTLDHLLRATRGGPFPC